MKYLLIMLFGQRGMSAADVLQFNKWMESNTAV